MEKEVRKQRLKKVKVDNYKGCRHVEVDIRENRLVLIGGRNGAGKSSVVDAVRTLLSGKKFAMRPIREGAKEAVIEAELTDFIAKLTITESGSIDPVLLDLESGRKVQNPKRAMRQMFGEHAIEPSQFLRLSPGEKRDVLRSLILGPDGKPLDTSKLDKDYADAYEARAAAKAEAKRCQNVLSSTPSVEDAPTEPVKSDAILEQLKKITDHNNAIAAADAKHGANVKEEAAAQRQVDALKKQLKDAEDNLKRCSKRSAEALQEVEKLGKPKPTAEVEKALASVDAQNEKYHQHQDHLKAREAFVSADDARENAEKKVAELEEQRRALLENAVYPVKGLAFTDEGATIDGIPFEDCSRSRQEVAAIEIAMAQTDKPLSVAFVDDGEVFDDETIAMVHKLVEEKDAQLLLVCGSRLNHYDLFMENGQAKA